MPKSFLLFFVAVLTFFAGSARAEQYYAEFYSWDSTPRTARGSHTFARFLKVEDGKVEVVDISWLPEAGHFGPNGQMPLFKTVPGKNYSLSETYDLAAQYRLTIQEHGKYEIGRAFFEDAQKRAVDLGSGKIAYKMLDGRTYPEATNCIHAVTGIVDYYDTGLRFGREATDAVVHYFSRNRRLGNRVGAAQGNVDYSQQQAQNDWGQRPDWGTASNSPDWGNGNKAPDWGAPGNNGGTH